MAKLTYSKFVSRIDLDEVYAELGFDVIENDGKGNDIGTCILPYDMHAHGDTTGKFAFHREKKIYNCWVCGGGSLLDLVMAVRDCSSEEATNWLFQFTGPVEDRGEEFMSRIASIMNPEVKGAQTKPFYNPKVIEKWQESDHPWFAERGINTWTADHFKLGYNPTNRKYAPKRDGKPIDEPFQGPAIILPHFWEGKLMGWQIRWLTDDRPKWANKYDNTGDFPKSYTVWGYDFCAQVDDPPVVVESVPTALMLISMGYPAMATFGASVTEGQVKILRRFQNGVILSPDKGSVGEDSYWGLAGALRRHIPVMWAEPPEDLNEKEDLGDLVKTPDLIYNCVEEAKTLF